MYVRASDHRARLSPDSSGIVDIPNGFYDIMEIDGNPAGPARKVCILVLAADLESTFTTFLTTCLLSLSLRFYIPEMTCPWPRRAARRGC